jgi:hypothetical protein
MTSVVPGYWHETVPVPHAAQGLVAHAAETKTFVHVPAAHTWLAAQAPPQTPGLAEQ